MSLPTAHAAAHLHPSQRACGQNYTTANSLHLSIPPANITHFLPSCFFGFLPSFLPSLSPPPPPQITAVFTRALGDLPTRPCKRSDLPYWAFKKKKGQTKKKEAPPKSYWARCLLTHWPPGVDVVVFVRRCILRQQVKTAYCNTSISTKFSNSFLCSVYCISSSVSFHLPPLVWSVTKFLARLHC